MGLDDLMLRLEYWCEQHGIKVEYAYAAMGVFALLILASGLFLIPWGGEEIEEIIEVPDSYVPQEPVEIVEEQPTFISPSIITAGLILTEADIDEVFTFDIAGTAQKTALLNFVSDDGLAIYEKKSLGWSTGTHGSNIVSLKLTKSIFDKMGEGCNELSIIVDEAESDPDCIYVERIVDDPEPAAKIYSFSVLTKTLDILNRANGVEIEVKPKPPESMRVYGYAYYEKDKYVPLGILSHKRDVTGGAVYGAILSETNFGKLKSGCNDVKLKIDFQEYGPKCLSVDKDAPGWFTDLSVEINQTTIETYRDELSLMFYGPPSKYVDVQIEQDDVLKTYNRYVQLDEGGLAQKEMIFTSAEFKQLFTQSGLYKIVPYLDEDHTFSHQGTGLHVELQDECNVEGERKCDLNAQNKYFVCEESGDRKQWGESLTCSGSQLCDEGLCVDRDCTDVCSSGSWECSKDGHYQKCGEWYEHDCLDWSYEAANTGCLSELCDPDKSSPSCWTDLECEQGDYRACYDVAPSSFGGVGQCEMGIQWCNEYEWDVCEGDIAPKNEVCDGRDNNCDGAIDESCSPPDFTLAGRIALDEMSVNECNIGASLSNDLEVSVYLNVRFKGYDWCHEEEDGISILDYSEISEVDMCVPDPMPLSMREAVVNSYLQVAQMCADEQGINLDALPYIDFEVYYEIDYYDEYEESNENNNALTQVLRIQGGGSSCTDADNDGYYAENDCLPHDCDDTSALCNEDCTSKKYFDPDGDGYGSASNLLGCKAEGDFTADQSGDCNNNDGSIHPGADEICYNDVDEDCDGSKTNNCDICEDPSTDCTDSDMEDCMVPDCVNQQCSQKESFAPAGSACMTGGEKGTCTADGICEASGGGPGCQGTHECETDGYPVCNSDNAYAECKDVDGDFCRDIVLEQCTDSEECSLSEPHCDPVTLCPNDCSDDGYPACFDGVHKKCLDHNNDGCFDFIEPTTCVDIITDDCLLPGCSDESGCSQNEEYEASGTVCETRDGKLGRCDAVGECIAEGGPGGNLDCIGGILHGQCSTPKPEMCDNGAFIDNCQKCGCPSDRKYTCEDDGTCAPEIEVENKCSDQTIFGQCSTVTLPMYCDGGDLVPRCDICDCPQDKPECDSLSLMCIESHPDRCDDGTAYGQCSDITLPMYCDNDGLIPRCDICDCPANKPLCDPMSLECKEKGPTVPTECEDGTPLGYCSDAGRPIYCNEKGELVDNCTVCFCPSASDVCNHESGVCISEGEDCPDDCTADYPFCNIEEDYEICIDKDGDGCYSDTDTQTCLDYNVNDCLAEGCDDNLGCQQNQGYEPAGYVCYENGDAGRCNNVGECVVDGPPTCTHECNPVSSGYPICILDVGPHMSCVLNPADNCYDVLEKDCDIEDNDPQCAEAYCTNDDVGCRIELYDDTVDCTTTDGRPGYCDAGYCALIPPECSVATDCTDEDENDCLLPDCDGGKCYQGRIPLVDNEACETSNGQAGVCNANGDCTVENCDECQLGDTNLGCHNNLNEHWACGNFDTDSCLDLLITSCNIGDYDSECATPDCTDVDGCGILKVGSQQCTTDDNGRAGHCSDGYCIPNTPASCYNDAGCVSVDIIPGDCLLPKCDGGSCVQESIPQTNGEDCVLNGDAGTCNDDGDCVVSNEDCTKHEDCFYLDDDISDCQLPGCSSGDCVPGGWFEAEGTPCYDFAGGGYGGTCSVDGQCENFFGQDCHECSKYDSIVCSSPTVSATCLDENEDKCLEEVFEEDCTTMVDDEPDDCFLPGCEPGVGCLQRGTLEIEGEDCVTDNDQLGGCNDNGVCEVGQGCPEPQCDHSSFDYPRCSTDNQGRLFEINCATDENDCEMEVPRECTDLKTYDCRVPACSANGCYEVNAQEGAVCTESGEDGECNNNGVCIVPDQCNSCDNGLYPMCQDNVYKQCVESVTNSGCFDYVSSVPCNNDQYCSLEAPHCRTCSSSCNPNDNPICVPSEDKFYNCVEDNNGCWVLELWKDCAAQGKTCSVYYDDCAGGGGGCSGECNTGNYPLCRNNRIYDCEENVQGCYEEVLTQDCVAQGQICTEWVRDCFDGGGGASDVDLAVADILVSGGGAYASTVDVRICNHGTETAPSISTFFVMKLRLTGSDTWCVYAESSSDSAIESYDEPGECTNFFLFQDTEYYDGIIQDICGFSIIDANVDVYVSISADGAIQELDYDNNERWESLCIGDCDPIVSNPDESEILCEAATDQTTTPAANPPNEYAFDYGIAYLGASRFELSLEPNCCGDDANEWLLRNGGAENQESCCNAYTDCVMANGNCVRHNQLYNLGSTLCWRNWWYPCDATFECAGHTNNLGAMGLDVECYRNVATGEYDFMPWQDDEICGNNIDDDCDGKVDTQDTECAVDPDTDENYCIAANDITPNDDGIEFGGVFSGGVTTGPCCGDDGGEYLISQKVERKPGQYNTFSGDQDVDVCCNDGGNCPMWNSNCATPGILNGYPMLYCNAEGGPHENIMSVCTNDMIGITRGNYVCCDISGTRKWVSGSSC